MLQKYVTGSQSSRQMDIQCNVLVLQSLRAGGATYNFIYERGSVARLTNPVFPYSAFKSVTNAEEHVGCSGLLGAATTDLRVAQTHVLDGFLQLPSEPQLLLLLLLQVS